MPDPIPADMAAFAGEIQQLAQQGNFNPFSLLAGETAFHSVFLAPLSPALTGAIRQFLADGTGPLGDVVRQFQSQGLAPVEAAARARELFGAARGVLVVVLVGDHGVMTVPHLFFGVLDAAMREQTVAACGPEFPYRNQLAQALEELEGKARRGVEGTALVAGPGAAAGYWRDLGERLLDGVDTGMFSKLNERQADLAHWTGSALETERLDDAGILVAARCHLLAGDGPRAAAFLDRLLHDDADADALAELAVKLVEATCASGQPREVGDWLAAFLPRFEERFGVCYELRLAAFTTAVAGLRPVEAQVAAARLLSAANRKAARMDLTREPLWRVTVPVPAEDLLDTAAAAAALDKDAAFVVKRLDQGTIPTVHQGEQVRIPRPALLAWQAIMQDLGIA